MKLFFIMIFMLSGLFFFGVGTLGLFRFKDVLSRAHSAAKCDTLGAFLCTSSLMMVSGFHFASMKLLLIIIFLWLTNPTATHLIAKAEVKRNKKQYDEVIMNGDI